MHLLIHPDGQNLDGRCDGKLGIARARDAGQPVTKPDEKGRGGKCLSNSLGTKASGGTTCDTDQSCVTEMTLNAPDIPAPNPAAVFGVWRSLFTKTFAAGSYQINQYTTFGPHVPRFRSNFTVLT